MNAFVFVSLCGAVLKHDFITKSMSHELTRLTTAKILASQNPVKLLIKNKIKKMNAYKFFLGL